MYECGNTGYVAVREAREESLRGTERPLVVMSEGIPGAASSGHVRGGPGAAAYFFNHLFCIIIVESQHIHLL